MISTSNNRLTSTGWSYDSAGNTTNDPQGRTFIYDAENKQTEVRDQYNTVISQYFFDGDGKRIKKIVPATGEVTIFVYDASGKSIAEYSTVVASIETATVAKLTANHVSSPFFCFTVHQGLTEYDGILYNLSFSTASRFDAS